jgi:hypothetical protein
MGNGRFDDGRGLGDCKNRNTGDPVRLYGLNVCGLEFDPQVCFCVRSDYPSSFVSRHKKSH